MVFFVTFDLSLGVENSRVAEWGPIPFQFHSVEPRIMATPFHFISQNEEASRFALPGMPKHSHFIPQIRESIFLLVAALEADIRHEHCIDKTSRGIY